MFLRLISICCLAFLFYYFTTSISSCAIIVPPSGGDKDSTAPKLLKVIPKENALNITTKTITFEFDEYIQTENAEAAILISPLPSTPPEIKAKLRTLTIKLKDSLEANTTYSIAINGAVKDVNEGNKLTDLIYSFSTGNSLDSNTLSGNVVLAENGKTDSTLIVALYANFKDSAVAKERPKYIAKLNGSGNFSFKNLPNKKFVLVAFADDGGQKKYTSPKQLFAFSDSIIDAAKNKTRITLYAYTEEKEEQKATPDKASETKIKLGNTLQNGLQDILADLNIFSNKKINKLDTSKFLLTDTSYTKTFAKKIVLDSFKKNITVQSNWLPENTYRLIIPTNAIADEKGNGLTKSDTLKFSAKSKKEYGNVVIRFSSIDFSKNPVLQIVQNDKIVNSYSLTTFKLNIPLLNPGDYELRILYDTNKNKTWDAGSYFLRKKQPEIVQSLSKKLSVKADWDNELEIEEKF
jgi:hypothetical protein